jgi:hypothetical protein
MTLVSVGREHQQVHLWFLITRSGLIMVAMDQERTTSVYVQCKVKLSV